MLHTQDKQILQAKGISEAQVEEQLHAFRTGFPFLKINRAAEAGKDRTMGPLSARQRIGVEVRSRFGSRQPYVQEPF